MNAFRRGARIFANYFILWVLLLAVAAYFFPAPFAAMKDLIVPGLGIIMFGMGITLVPADFRRVLKMPWAVFCGVLGQFLIMPSLGWALARLFQLPNDVAMGFIILGACPGGTSSNVICYLAKADVALSVTMTAISTLLAIVLTPLLVLWLGGAYLPVDAWGLFMSVVKIVLIPVSTGLLIHIWLKDRLEPFLDAMPAVSVLVIALIVATVTAINHDALPQVVGLLGIGVILHNSAGYALGYALAMLFRLPVTARRTVAVEVGMQNSGLGVALATTHFTTLAALPATLFSVVHSITGATLASIWQKRPVDSSAADQTLVSPEVNEA